MAKRGFNDEDYDHHDGPCGSPADWAGKARGVLREQSDKDPTLAESLAVLGLTEVVTPMNVSTLKRAYRKVVQEVHPDRGGSAESFKNATDAFENAKRILGV